MRRKFMQYITIFTLILEWDKYLCSLIEQGVFIYNYRKTTFKLRNGFGSNKMWECILSSQNELVDIVKVDEPLVPVIITR